MATEPSNEAVEAADDRIKPPFLRQVRIRGYKSIAFCDVCLQPLTVLVGRNAAGKSNFLDALAFVRDAMEMSVPEAVKRRGGWSSVVCRSSATQKIEIDIEASFTCGGPYERISRNGPSGSASPNSGTLPDLTGVTYTSIYHLEFSAGPHSSPVISKERLEITGEPNQWHGGFEVDNGVVSRWFSEGAPLAIDHSRQLLSVVRPDQPLLGMIGKQPLIDFGDGLRWMGFYNFHPEAVRALQKPNPGWLMEKDGRNLASVIETTRENEQGVIERVGRYLSVITQSVELLDVAKYGEYETVRFRVARNHQDKRLEFDAASMSDGTLRTLAALVAAFQIVLPHGYPSLVAIEEPETSLHPAAMRALVDALDEATARTQILLTTHSAELLDNPTIRPDNVRVVEMIGGQTVIAPVDGASVDIVRRKLNTLGGLVRDDLLEPDADEVDRQQRLGQSCEVQPA